MLGSETEKSEAFTSVGLTGRNLCTVVHIGFEPVNSPSQVNREFSVRRRVMVSVGEWESKKTS